jgi:hypothetical protein
MIPVTADVHERVLLLARAWEISAGEVVGRLLDEFLADGDEPHGPDGSDAAEQGVLIHAVYEGNRIDAIYWPATRRVDVTSGTLTGRSYKSPSGVAIAVVQAYNPSVHPNRNGWTFWTVTASGEMLQSIRPSEASRPRTPDL